MYETKLVNRNTRVPRSLYPFRREKQGKEIDNRSHRCLRKSFRLSRSCRFRAGTKKRGVVLKGETLSLSLSQLEERWQYKKAGNEKKIEREKKRLT